MQRRLGRPAVPEVTTMSLTESEPTGAGSKSGWVTAGDEFHENLSFVLLRHMSVMHDR